MNLMTGLIQPSQGSIDILGIATDDPEKLFRKLAYSTQYDSFPRGFTGYQFLYSYLLVHGYTPAEADELTREGLERVKLTEAGNRRVAAYSKGMRQRIKLAQAICHKPSVLVLDEPLNGLDPMARAEIIDLFQGLAKAGMHVIISSHVLHEVDLISDQVVLLSEGYVVAEGDIRGVRDEMEDHPLQVMIRCDRPSVIASRMFEQDSVVEVKIHEDRQGLMVSTRDVERFFLLLNRIVLDNRLKVESVAPTDDDVASVYQYLIGGNGESS
jgi:ABC-2 type transport system ATP-binding protein